jgi:hypothetical protein
MKSLRTRIAKIERLEELHAAIETEMARIRAWPDGQLIIDSVIAEIRGSGPNGQPNPVSKDESQ